MGRVVTGGGMGYLAIAYGASVLQEEPEFYERLQYHRSQIPETNAGYADRLMGMYNAHHGSRAMAEINAALHMAADGPKDIGYHYFNTVPEYQQAGLDMQRMVMAIPEVVTAVNKGVMYGYANTYTPSEPHLPAEWRSDYRRFTNGTFVEGEWDSVTGAFLSEGYEIEHFGDDDEIVQSGTHREKLIFEHTRSFMRKILADRTGGEPTSPYNDQF